MTTAIEKTSTNGHSLDAGLAELVLVKGDMSKLNDEQRLEYVLTLCKSLGLNPATRPFEYVTLQGKLTLYARKDATEQLRRIYRVSITDLQETVTNDICRVKAYASMPDGRTDTATGAVSIKGLAGDALANAFMKAETKAKRRVTLSICGLGMLDETELETIPDAQPVPAPPQRKVVVQAGEIIEPELSEAQLRAGIKSNFRTLQERHWTQERIQGEYAKVITDGTPSTELSREQLLPVYTHFEQLVSGSFVEA